MIGKTNLQGWCRVETNLEGWVKVGTNLEGWARVGTNLVSCKQFQDVHPHGLCPLLKGLLTFLAHFLDNLDAEFVT